MSINLKTFLREILIRVILTIGKWIVDHLDPDGDGSPDNGTGG